MSTSPIEQHVLLRRRTFAITRPTYTVLAELISSLHDEHATGQLTIHLSQGSIQSAQFEEQTKLNLT